MRTSRKQKENSTHTPRCQKASFAHANTKRHFGNKQLVVPYTMLSFKTFQKSSILNNHHCDNHYELVVYAKDWLSVVDYCFAQCILRTILVATRGRPTHLNSGRWNSIAMNPLLCLLFFYKVTTLNMMLAKLSGAFTRRVSTTREWPERESSQARRGFHGGGNS